MKPLRKSADIPSQNFENCHNGGGVLVCKSLTDELGARKIVFMHHDMIASDVSIGSHPHDSNEEIYYLIKGSGTLLFDDESYDFHAGDISVCTPGHSHGFTALTDCELIVVGGECYETEESKL